jgi:divalent metal cation (Fe/Co/Zn/Cd) transporter
VPSGSTRVVIAALIGNSAIAVIKFIAATLTGSAAMFAEGVHSVVDTGNQTLLLVGLKRAAKPADKYHPFGYGKEIYFWAFVVAIILFALGRASRSMRASRKYATLIL